ncbi:retrotransposon protein, putative, ty1-copia subclass [Tanacetum coccineum]
MFQAKASKEHLDVVKSLMACKPKPGASICAFFLEMKGYFDRLESLNMVFDTELSINIILSGLPANYNQFVLSYQMNRKETSIMELHSLLQTAEKEIKKSDVPSTSATPVLTVGHNAKKRKTSHSNWKGKATQGKSDRGSKRKDLKDGKVEKGVHSGMYMIELYNTTTSDSWILDTGCGTHICAVLQGLKESRRLKHRELNLIMGNRKITPVTRIGKFELMLKSGVRINLNNYCYSSEMTRNIISFHALFKDGYQFSFDKENGDILVYSNGCFMFKASPCKGIYETFECISNDGNMILNVGSSNELDKSKLWHSRLGHVNKKRIAQLQKDGVLESFDFKLDDVCESCLLGKMTKSPFTGTCERGEGLFIQEVSKRSREPTGKKDKETLPISFWGYALKTTTCILNLVPTKKVSKTPFEMWKGKRPSLWHIKIWGCEVFVKREAQGKLEARSEKCLFIGYLEESFGYLFYKPKDNVVFVARRGVFLEREMISKEDSESKIDFEEIQESTDEEPIINTDTQQEVVTHVEPDDISLPIRKTSSKNLVDTTPGLKTVGCKWIFKKKTDMYGKVHTYKARLVAKGYTQTHKIDYEETFSPVAKIKSIRIMLAIAAFHDYEIWQMDVKTTFLNGKLTENVFMAQPEGFENEKYHKRVCKLQKSIYGLKEASRS